MKIPFEMMPDVETQRRIVAAYKEIQDVPFSTEESFMAMMVDGSEATPREIIITLSLATNPMALAAYGAWLQQKNHEQTKLDAGPDPRNPPHENRHP